jgi:hypothetical protein
LEDSASGAWPGMYFLWFYVGEYWQSCLAAIAVFISIASPFF